MNFIKKYFKNKTLKNFIFERPTTTFFICSLINILLSFAIFSIFAGPGIQRSALESVSSISNLFQESNLEIKLIDDRYEINQTLPFYLTSESFTTFTGRTNLLKVTDSTENLAEDLVKNFLVLTRNNLHFLVEGEKVDFEIKSLTSNQNPLTINSSSINSFFYENLDIDGWGFYSLSFNILALIKSITFFIYFLFAISLVPILVWGILKISGYEQIKMRVARRYSLLFYSIYLLLSNIFFFTIGELGFLPLMMLSFFGVSIYLKVKLDRGQNIN